MANWAEQMFAEAVAIARLINSDPAVVEARRRHAVAVAKKRREEEAEARARAEAAAAERQRSRAYDAWALNGGGDECTQFGINDGCKPWCPVFERGRCHIQAENEEAFASPSPDHAQEI